MQSCLLMIWLLPYLMVSTLLVTMPILTPTLCSGQPKNYVAKDTFNLYLSQCRICIEQVFGQLTIFLKVFNSPLRVKLKNVPSLILAVMRLHDI
jgi:hypothetical protein